MILWGLLAIFLGLLGGRVVLLFNRPPTADRPFRSIAELAEKLETKEYSNILESEYNIQNIFGYGKTLDPDFFNSDAKRLQRAYQVNPSEIETNISETIRRVVNGSKNYVAIVYETTYQSAVRSSIYSCQIEKLSSSGTIPAGYITLFLSPALAESLKKEAKYKKDMRHLNVNQLRVIHQEYERLLRLYHPEKNPCEPAVTYDTRKSLELSQIQAAFWLLLFFFALCMVSLFGEWIADATLSRLGRRKDDTT